MKLPLLLFALLGFALCHAAERITSIQLEDQFGENHRIEFPTGRAVILTVADMKGAESMDPWLAALKERYSTNVTYVGVADVRPVPAPLRSFVRQRFKKKYSYPILLDWKGTILERLSSKSSVPNIYLLTTTGEILQHLSGPFTPERLAAMPRPPIPAPPLGYK